MGKFDEIPVFVPLTDFAKAIIKLVVDTISNGPKKNCTVVRVAGMSYAVLKQERKKR